MNVLRTVRQLEIAQPAPSNLLSDTAVSQKLLDGVWYLQYTSPSQVGAVDYDKWIPEFANEGDSNIPTTSFAARGSISAAGITVDTSNKMVQQNIDVVNRRVENVIQQDWGRVRVAGSFRPSSRIPNRLVVAFDNAEIRFGKEKSSPVLNLSFLFRIIAAIRKSDDNGWLETTFIDKEMRIGRGNKGTMFVLTRDPTTVRP